MSCEHLIVDSISSSPSVLYDLDSSFNTFVASRIETQPPRRRRAWASSTMVDGSVLAAESFENREITVTMRPRAGADAQEQAADMMTLQRLFAAGGHWLKHRPEGVTEPVFYRLFPADVDVLNLYETGHPDRDLVFTIPADPHAYGLPESGTATVVNDPTEPNGMRFEISGVKGDVPAPLRLELDYVDGRPTNATVGASTHIPLDHAAPAGSPGTAESTAIGGFMRRTTGTLDTGRFDFGSVKPGEYRLFIRCRSSATGSMIKAYPDTGPPENIGGPFSGSYAVAATWKWIDLGVFRLPFMSRQPSPLNPASTASGSVIYRVDADSSGDIDIDHALLLPAPGGDGEAGTVLMMTTRPVGDVVSVDAHSHETWMPGGSGATFTLASQGGFPLVSPGTTNLVTFVGVGVSGGDDKTDTIDVDWSYHPRYLYLRGD